jgi:uncharacterized protein involved in outer membrane biogenesis
MLKKVLIGGAVLIVLAGTILHFRAQAIVSSDLVRASVGAQLSRVLGQPVAIGSIRARLLPRVSVVLSEVRIGTPARITIASLDFGTSARALLARRIDEATVRITGARIALPLPSFSIGGSDSAPDDSPALTVGSIAEVVLTDIQIDSGGRTLRGDGRVVPQGAGMRIESMTLALDDTAVDVTGDITSFEGPVGTLVLRATSLNMLALQAFAADFAAGAGLGEASRPARPAPASTSPNAAPMNLLIDITADRASFGTLALDALTGRARMTDEQLAIDDMDFGFLEGRYTGAVTLGVTATPTFHVRGRVVNVSMAALTAWAGRPGVMTGRLAGSFNAAGSGTTADRIVASTTGTARIDVAQGTVQGLALVRTLVIAGAMRADSTADGTGSEAFSRMGASFTLGNGLARTKNLTFESNDVSFEGAGQIGLDGAAIDLAGRVRLSEALTKEAGRDLVRYTQEGGRVTVPVSISGSAGDLNVRLETVDLLKRALTNKALEEAGEALRRGIGGLFNR